VMMGAEVAPALLMAAVSDGDDERFAARCAQVLTSSEHAADLLKLPPPPAAGRASAPLPLPPNSVFVIEAALRQDAELTAASLVGHGAVETMGPAMLRRVLRALCGEALEGPVLELCLEAAARVDGADPWLLEALAQVLEADPDLAYAELSASFADTPLAWDERFEALAWRLHPEGAVAGLAARAMSPQLDAAARRRALDALAFAPGRAAADAVAVAAVAGPEDLRGYAGWWVEHRSGNDWRDYGLNISTGTLADAERAWASEVMGEGTVDFDVALERASMAWLVVTNGGDGNSCDWAAWIDPRVVLADGREVSLSSGWVEARAEWGSVNSNRDPQGGPLEVGEVTYERGIGTHAHSEVAFALPAGAVRLLGSCGPERGGTEQNIGSSTSVTFEVWIERADEPAAVLEWLAEFTAEDASAETRRAAMERLASNEQGALLLIQAKRDGDLDPALVPDVAALLHGSDQLAIRALASEHFERPGLEGTEIPSIGELMALEGDAARGREVFLDEERARCVTCHAFQLGDVRVGIDLGPELTQIRKKLTGEALFDAILNPSASIAFGYDTYLLETEDGLLHSGFLLADGATVALLETDGERVTFGRDEIKQRTKQKVSTMPQGLASDLTPQELADLVAFLGEDHGAEPDFGEPVVLFDGGGLDAWTYHLSDPSVAFGDVWSLRDGVIRCEGRPSGYLKTRESFESYLLTLEWRFDPASGPGNSGVLLRMTGEDKVWPRSIEAQLQHRNAGDFWNIDAFGMRTNPTRLRGRNTKRRAPSSERPVGEWNRYEILVDGPRVELRVNGVLQNTADWCEEVAGPICLQSEGAVIEFRDIQLRPIRR
jgi:putative heme-binding domain-containing protein